MVESEADPASSRIADALRALTAFEATPHIVEGRQVERWTGPHDVRLVRIPYLHLEAEPLAQTLPAAGVRPDAVVFLSRHKADSGRSALTVHPVGNPGEAKYGGQPGRFSPCAPALQTMLLRALVHQTRAGYPSEATFEATHHGPLLPWPMCYLELGSGPAQWNDPKGATAVAAALVQVMDTGPPSEAPTLIGVGGGHYAPRCVEAALNKSVHIGHMLAGHALSSTTDLDALVGEAVAKTPTASGYLVHKGGLPTDLFDRIDKAFQPFSLPRYDIKSLPTTAGQPRVNS